MKNKLFIFGASGLAELALFYAKSELEYEVAGFVVDGEYKQSDYIASLPVYVWDAFEAEYSNSDVSLFSAVGYKDISARAKVFERIKNAGFNMINIISPSSYVAGDVVFKENNFVMPGVVLETGVEIADNNIIWSNATICHNAKIGSHNFIAANVTIGGETIIGNKNFFGFSSTLLQQKKVGSDTLVGAHSLIMHNTQDASVYHGIPARQKSRLVNGIKINQ